MNPFWPPNIVQRTPKGPQRAPNRVSPGFIFSCFFMFFWAPQPKGIPDPSQAPPPPLLGSIFVSKATKIGSESINKITTVEPLLSILNVFLEPTANMFRSCLVYYVNNLCQEIRHKVEHDVAWTCQEFRHKVDHDVAWTAVVLARTAVMLAWTAVM